MLKIKTIVNRALNNRVVYLRSRYLEPRINVAVLLLKLFKVNGIFNSVLSRRLFGYILSRRFLISRLIMKIRVVTAVYCPEDNKDYSDNN